MKKMLFLLTGVIICTLVIACGGGQQVTGPNTVKLLSATFSNSTISIRKGETITFVDDSGNGGLHILVVGKNGEPVSEKGTPDFGGLAGERLDVGDVWTSPPWNIAGTFHLTCTAHPATMNLTVNVT